MNEKAFNLFTALVSFILIILSGLLVGTMIQAENTTKNILVRMEEQARVEAVAEIVKTDAVQYFNFMIRKEMEEYFANPNTGTITLNTKELQWDEVVDDFRETYFSSGGKKVDRFAGEMAAYLEGLYNGMRFSYSTYDIDLKEVKREQLKKAIIGMSDEAGEEFFKVIECPDGEPDDCLGTFYVTLAVKEMAEENPELYERLPKIVVRDIATDRVVQNPVLPRKNIQIYVPLRIFKALAVAKKVAGELNNKQAEFKKYALGVCEKESCNARTNFLQAEPFTSINSMCAGDRRANAQSNNAYPNQKSGMQDVLYNPNNRTAIESAVEVIAEEKICEMDFGIRDIGEKFSVEGDAECDGEVFKDKITVESTALDSATIKHTGYLSEQFTGSYNSSCAVISRIEVELKMKESNTDYMVTKSAQQGSPSLEFTLKVVDDFTPQLPNNAEAGWQCISNLEISPPAKDYSASCKPASSVAP